jgi:hypothetical protein
MEILSNKLYQRYQAGISLQKQYNSPFWIFSEKSYAKITKLKKNAERVTKNCLSTIPQKPRKIFIEVSC